jgi:hypothetical protein
MKLFCLYSWISILLMLYIKSQRSYYRLSIEQRQCPWLYFFNYLLVLSARLTWERKKREKKENYLSAWTNTTIIFDVLRLYTDVDGRLSIRTERSPMMACMQTQSLFGGCWINELAVCLYVCIFDFSWCSWLCVKVNTGQYRDIQ